MMDVKRALRYMEAFAQSLAMSWDGDAARCEELAHEGHRVSCHLCTYLCDRCTIEELEEKLRVEEKKRSQSLLKFLREGQAKQCHSQ